VVQDFRPVEVRAAGLDDLAYRAAPGAGCPPYEVAALLLQQRFVTADQVDRKQLVAKKPMRRRICLASSVRISVLWMRISSPLPMALRGSFSICTCTEAVVSGITSRPLASTTENFDCMVSSSCDTRASVFRDRLVWLKRSGPNLSE